MFWPWDKNNANADWDEIFIGAKSSLKCNSLARKKLSLPTSPYRFNGPYKVYGLPNAVYITIRQQCDLAISYQLNLKPGKKVIDVISSTARINRKIV